MKGDYWGLCAPVGRYRLIIIGNSNIACTYLVRQLAGAWTPALKHQATLWIRCASGEYGLQSTTNLQSSWCVNCCVSLHEGPTNYIGNSTPVNPCVRTFMVFVIWSVAYICFVVWLHEIVPYAFFINMMGKLITAITKRDKNPVRSPGAKILEDVQGGSRRHVPLIWHMTAFLIS